MTGEELEKVEQAPTEHRESGCSKNHSTGHALRGTHITNPTNSRVDQSVVVELVGRLRALEGEIEARKTVLADQDPVVSRGQEDLRNLSYEADADIVRLRKNHQKALQRMAEVMPADRWIHHGTKLLYLRTPGYGKELTEHANCTGANSEPTLSPRPPSGGFDTLQLYEMPARDEEWIPEECREEPVTTMLRAAYARWEREGLRQLVAMAALPAGAFASVYWLLGPGLPAAPYLLIGLIVTALFFFPRGREYVAAMWGVEGVHHPFGLVEPGTPPGRHSSSTLDIRRTVLLQARLRSLEESLKVRGEPQGARRAREPSCRNREVR